MMMKQYFSEGLKKPTGYNGTDYNPINPWWWLRDLGNGHRSIKDLHTHYWLVVTGTMEFYDFPYVGNVITPTD